MTEMLTLKVPKEDVEAFLRVIEDIELIKEAEVGDKEIVEGRFKKLEDLENKYKVQS
ncbi:MAG TPA: hypothetical protein VJB06_01450 [archaeon]|nr:hypothetical protein [archaeon]